MSADDGFVSGGSKSYYTCGTCDMYYPDGHYSGFGFCILRDYASVSHTGHCGWHTVELRYKEERGV